METRATGQERETGERAEEHMGAQERVVEVAQPVVEQPSSEYFTKVGACLAGRAGAVSGGWRFGRWEMGGQGSQQCFHADSLSSRGHASQGTPARGCSRRCTSHHSFLDSQFPVVYLLQTEDRPVVKERVTRMREHHPVE